MTKHEALGMVLVVLIALAALQVPVSPPNIRPDIEQIEWDRQPPNVASPERDGEEEMDYFGNKGFTGTDAGVEDTMILASLFPAGGGAALTTDLWAGSTPPIWPNWPAALGQNAGELGETNCSIWASYENDQITEAQAYIWTSAHPELDSVPVAVGVYSEAGQFFGEIRCGHTHAGRSGVGRVPVQYAGRD